MAIRKSVEFNKFVAETERQLTQRQFEIIEKNTSELQQIVVDVIKAEIPVSDAEIKKYVRFYKVPGLRYKIWFGDKKWNLGRNPANQVGTGLSVQFTRSNRIVISRGFVIPVNQRNIVKQRISKTKYISRTTQSPAQVARARHRDIVRAVEKYIERKY